MRLRIIGMGFAGAACLFGQARQFSWQDLCFKNPAAPVCHGNDYAIKPKAQPKDTAPKSMVTNPFPSKPGTAKSSVVKPSLMAVAAIDWRFADPLADALIGFNLAGISGSPLAHSVISLLATKQGLADADVQRIFDGMADVDQVALSVRNNRVVAMITGHVADTALPAPQAGMKVVPVSGGVMLIGHADAVDQAMQRIATKSAPTALMRSAEERQASSEFWVLGSARLVGPQAASAGVKQFSMTVWIRNRLTSDMTIEFNGPPSANTIRALQGSLGSGATFEGNAVHAKASLEAAEVQQKVGEMAAGPLGQGLAALVDAARYLPVPDNSVPKQTKPIIYGLDPVR